MTRSHNNAPRRDIHAEVTAKLLAAIETGPGEFQLPWRQRAGGLKIPRNAVTKNTYAGINVVHLFAAGHMRGFSSNLWASYKQWESIGAQVRKGAKAEMVVFYRSYQADPDPANEDDDGKRRVARASAVFNADEVEGLESAPAPEPQPLIDRLEAVDRFIESARVPIIIGGDSACYRHATDTIHMPAEHLFTGTDTMTRQEAFYATELHELGHATGHKSRLNRPVPKAFGDPLYQMEELIVEVMAAQLCAELGITQDVRADHAQYLHHWISMMRADPKVIFKAAARASEAITYLKNLQPGTKAQHDQHAEEGDQIAA